MEDLGISGLVKICNAFGTGKQSWVCKIESSWHIKTWQTQHQPGENRWNIHKQMPTCNWECMPTAEPTAFPIGSRCNISTFSTWAVSAMNRTPKHPQTITTHHNTIQPRSTHYITSHNIEEHPVSRLGNMPWAHPSASPMNMNKSCIELHACSRSSTGICSGGTLKACAMHGSTWRLQHAVTGFSMFLLNTYYEMMTPTLQIIRM